MDRASICPRRDGPLPKTLRPDHFNIDQTRRHYVGNFPALRKYLTSSQPKSVAIFINMKLIPTILLCTLLISQSLPRCHGYNILILGVHPFFSHLLMLSTIANELATQGHNVTFVTVKATRHHPKLTVINNEDVMHSLMSKFCCDTDIFSSPITAIT